MEPRAARRFAALAAVSLAVRLAPGAAVVARQIPAPPEAPAAARAAGPEAPPIRIDVVARDRRGRPVLDLRPGDLELRVDGVSRRDARVELRTARAQAVPAPRVFAFLLDEFHVGPGEPTERVRRALARFVDAHLRPADLAVAVKPLEPLTAVRFTADREGLRQSIAAFSGRKGDLTPRSLFEEEHIGRAPDAVSGARAQIVTVALSELATRLGELGAERAAVVLVSDGFARRPARRAPRVPDLQGVLRAASRFHFAVYAFSPGGDAAAPGGTAASGRDGATLEWLAQETGGLWTSGGAALEDGLGRMAEELDAYYAITFDAEAADGRYHPVEIRAARAGVDVRSRPGFWAPLSSDVRSWLARSGAPAAVAPVRTLRRSRLIDAWVGVRPGTGVRPRVLLSWMRSAASAASAGAHRLEVRARVGAATVFEGTLAPAGGGGQAARFDAPPGRLELDMRVLAADGTLLDTDTRDVTVPDVAAASRPVVLPPEFVRARTVPEFRAVSADPDAPATPARAFSRSERLVIRVPAAGPAGADVTVTGRILNRTGAPMRALDRLPGAGQPGLAVFDLPLAWLAPGEYYVEITARSERGEVRERTGFRVTG